MPLVQILGASPESGPCICCLDVDSCPPRPVPDAAAQVMAVHNSGDDKLKTETAAENDDNNQGPRHCGSHLILDVAQSTSTAPSTQNHLAIVPSQASDGDHEHRPIFPALEAADNSSSGSACSRQAKAIKMDVPSEGVPASKPRQLFGGAQSNIGLAQLMTTMMLQGDHCTVQNAIKMPPRRSAIHLARRTRFSRLVDEGHDMFGLGGSLEVDCQLDAGNDSSPQPLERNRKPLSHTWEPLGINKLGSLRFRSSYEAGTSGHAMKRNNPRMRRRSKQSPSRPRPPTAHGNSHNLVDSDAKMD
ncbi:uncharacterized protein B0I36DRAFT_329709 [Microdochium trichocladiopsis]|uniref:Uncharacterized protein n=1 Tax=Microdochium trichocladiopsis TaxID=1682393 RepID=A0A9P9BM80_9PEZI|nr:uncharacterized protein B0I36DRAFT_329709 [Microdochium trichocladiopsis]KAH7026020.1 hypothetical protein B0I36DRAFT_329709 [Microdochium trichocladiopsis]